MATVWCSFRGSIWHSMRRATAWPRRMPWSVWWSKAGPTKSRSRERLLVPLFVVTAEANAGLVKMLPGILNQVRALVGQRRVTVVFDRGGYSPKLFQQMLASGFDLLTYRKGRYPHIPRKRFQACRTRRDGRTITYVLADQEVRQAWKRLRGMWG